MQQSRQSSDTPDKPVKGKFANRSLARRVAFQILYQEDLNPGSAAQFGDDYLTEQLPNNEPLRLFCRSLVAGTRLQRSEIDAKIMATAEHWTIERMAATDRNVLRLATYEMLNLDTPRTVVICEAVELAKNYGSTDSAAFVNGILDRIH